MALTLAAVQMGHVDVKHKRCMSETCDRQPIYGYAVDGVPIACSLHKEVRERTSCLDKTRLFSHASPFCTNDVLTNFGALSAQRDFVDVKHKCSRPRGAATGSAEQVEVRLLPRLECASLMVA